MAPLRCSVFVLTYMSCGHFSPVAQEVGWVILATVRMLVRFPFLVGVEVSLSKTPKTLTASDKLAVPLNG